MEGSQFLLKWNNHQPTVVSVLDYLLNQEAFIDVTLACEGQSFSAHKVILSACSPYFQDLLMKNPCKHPIIFLKDVRGRDIEALLQFMYRGEINVQQDDLAQFLRTAESLQIKGLADSSMKGGSGEPTSRGDPRPVDSDDDMTRDSAPEPSRGGSEANSRGPPRPADSSQPADPDSVDVLERSEKPNPNRSLLASALVKLGRPVTSSASTAASAPVETTGDGGSSAPPSTVYLPNSMDYEQAGPSRLTLATPPPPPPGMFPYALTPSPGALTPAASVKEELGQPTDSEWAGSGASGAGSTAADSPERGSENGDVRDPLDSPEKGGTLRLSSRWSSLIGRPSARSGGPASATAVTATAAAGSPFPTITPLMCKFCGQMFSDASNRFRHEKRHKHPEEVHVCFVCKRPFSRKDNMKKHIKTVHGVAAELEAEAASGGTVLTGHGNGWSAISLQPIDMSSGR